jgi:peptidoglycan/LPS O-acetylase OafA/YrhL
LKTVRPLIVTFSALLLVGLGASPAFAVGAGTPKPWHFWIAPILAISFIGILVALMVGYYLKVFRPKYRGR